MPNCLSTYYKISLNNVYNTLVAVDKSSSHFQENQMNTDHIWRCT